MAALTQKQKDDIDFKKNLEARVQCITLAMTYGKNKERPWGLADQIYRWVRYGNPRTPTS